VDINLKKSHHVIPWNARDYTFKHQRIFLGNFYIELLHFKIHENYMVFLFLRFFAHHFQITLSTHGSSLNSIFVSMNELEFFLLTRVLTLNSNFVELIKFLEKNQILHIQIIVVTLKMTSCRTIY
jgi:hypothetical protein